jgi:4-oxalocrotonate tautomerase
LPSATDFAALHPGCISSLNPVNQAHHAQPGGNHMPEVYVYAVEGRTLDQKRALIKDITDAVVRNFKVDPEVVMVQIMESPKTHKAKGGVLFSERTPKA